MEEPVVVDEEDGTGGTASGGSGDAIAAFASPDCCVVVSSFFADAGVTRVFVFLFDLEAGGGWSEFDDDASDSDGDVAESSCSAAGVSAGDAAGGGDADGIAPTSDMGVTRSFTMFDASAKDGVLIAAATADGGVANGWDFDKGGSSCRGLEADVADDGGKDGVESVESGSIAD